MKIVAFLQNPWRYNSKYAGKVWPRESWLSAFRTSHSGKRVIKHFGAHDIWWDNASPIVADNPKDIHPPDLLHMSKVINEQLADVVLTFGKPAKDGMKALLEQGVFAGSVLHLPHPAYRIVTGELFEEANKLLHSGGFDAVELKQGRGEICRIELPEVHECDARKAEGSDTAGSQKPPQK